MIQSSPCNSYQLLQYLLWDRDGIYGSGFRRLVARMGIEQGCRAPLAVAESLCGATHRIGTSGVPEPSYYLG
jgi:hypothetical protein